MRATLTLMLTILATFCHGECPIECYCDRIRTCTGDKLLTRFPKIYTSSSSSEIYPIRLELHEYGVTFLSAKDFLDIISNLTEISLTRNSLALIDNETFSLSSPYSQALPTSLGSEERHFFSAHLSSSSILPQPQGPQQSSTPDPGVLNLRILDLSQNRLSYFVGGPKLKRLKILDLSSNMMQQVYEFALMESLESVNLRDNRISYLQPTTFQNLRHLQYVNLDSNALGVIDPSTFSNLPAMAHLILSSNPISNRLPGFYWNSRIQFVDVSHCGLTFIPPSLTKTVRDFRCANNNLTIIRQTDFESYENVGLLVLDENAIETVEDDAFGRLDFLTRLWMNGNRLTRVPQNLPPSLQSLHLEDNRILNLSASDFKNLKNLQELNLHGNRISNLPAYVFADLTSLKSLDLRSNQIDVIYRNSFANLSKLQTLDMSQNPIKVIVIGAFESLQKLSLLHFSRVMDAIEFDTASFGPLHKLQILELDDSPHFAHKLLQESGLSHFPNLVELNLQRCELEDLNLVSNALSELNLRVVKMSGNPWDCQDLFGSAIHELMKRRVVVDEPVCDHPQGFKGVKVSSVNATVLSLLSTQSPAASQMFDLDENSSEEIPLDFTELTPEEPNYNANSLSLLPASQSSASSLDKVSNAPNTNSPENVPHAPDAPLPGPNTPNRPIRTGLGTKSVSGSSNPIFNLTAPSNSSNKSSEKVGPVGIPERGTSSADPEGSTKSQDRSTSGTLVVDTIPAKSTSDNNITSESTMSGGNSSRRSDDSDKRETTSRRSSNFDVESDPIPTRSYFDYSWSSISSKSLSGGDKKQASSIAIGSPRTEPVDKTKTNDDNTIIDEEALRRGYSARDDGEETGPKTIDGFPSDPLDKDRDPKDTPSSNRNAARDGRNRRPEAFYLRREYSNPDGNSEPYESSNKAIIVKTLIISATTCLASILILLSISYGFYRFAKRRSGIFSCSSENQNSARGESGGGSSCSSSASMSYTRFGRKKDGRNRRRDPYSPDHGHNRNQHPDIDSEDSDQVELSLSGITNRFYLENEDIYHIT